MSREVGIIGGGFVGGAIKHYFTEASVYDKYLESDPLEEVLEKKYIYVAVPTPFTDGGFDSSAIEEVFETIASNVTDKIVIIKSTVQTGLTDELQEKYPKLKVVFSPEFLDELKAKEHFANPARQIIGYTKQSKDVAEEILALQPPAPFMTCIPAKAAEMVKYFNNSFFAMKVVFANQIYDLCEAAGIDYEDVKNCAGNEPRIGKEHLEVVHKGYRGYGGKCLPKDVRTLLQFADSHDIDLSLVRQAEEANNSIRKKYEK